MEPSVTVLRFSANKIFQHYCDQKLEVNSIKKKKEMNTFIQPGCIKLTEVKTFILIQNNPETNVSVFLQKSAFE